LKNIVAALTDAWITIAFIGVIKLMNNGKLTFFSIALF
jgi:hypothetical protein